MIFEQKVSDYLNKWAVQLKEAKRSHFRIKAVNTAAIVVKTVPLEALIKANSLKSIKGIGEDIERVILEIHNTGGCAEIDNGTSGNKIVEETSHTNPNVIELCGMYEGDDKIECVDIATKKQTSCLRVEEEHPPKGMKEGDCFYIYVDITGKGFTWEIDGDNVEKECSFTYKKMSGKEYGKIFSNFISDSIVPKDSKKVKPIFYWWHSDRQTRLFEDLAGENPVVVVTPASHFDKNGYLCDGYCDNKKEEKELDDTLKTLKDLGFDVDISGCEGNRAIYHNGNEEKMLKVLNCLSIAQKNEKLGELLEGDYEEDED